MNLQHLIVHLLSTLCYVSAQKASTIYELHDQNNIRVSVSRAFYGWWLKANSSSSDTGSSPDRSTATDTNTLVLSFYGADGFLEQTTFGFGEGDLREWTRFNVTKTPDGANGQRITLSLKEETKNLQLVSVARTVLLSHQGKGTVFFTRRTPLELRVPTDEPTQATSEPKQVSIRDPKSASLPSSSPWWQSTIGKVILGSSGLLAVALVIIVICVWRIKRRNAQEGTASYQFFSSTAKGSVSLQPTTKQAPGIPPRKDLPPGENDIYNDARSLLPNAPGNNDAIYDDGTSPLPNALGGQNDSFYDDGRSPLPNAPGNNDSFYDDGRSTLPNAPGQNDFYDDGKSLMPNVEEEPEHIYDEFRPCQPNSSNTTGQNDAIYDDGTSPLPNVEKEPEHIYEEMILYKPNSQGQPKNF